MPDILITGGTGTLGKALVSKLYDKDWNRIFVFSRDENKQKAMAEVYPKITFISGDICNLEDLNSFGVSEWEHVYHCAAMKHIEVCETHVHRCVDINYTGTKNVYQTHGVKAKRFVFFSTDKAVAPINAYGHSKALAEHYLRQYTNTLMFRWGNIIGSTGSFFPYLLKCAYNNTPVKVTDSVMTRYWIHIEDAVKFVYDNRLVNDRGVLYPKMVTASIDTVITAVELLVGRKIQRQDMGHRPGEKIHEAMVNDKFGMRERSCQGTLTAQEFAKIIKPWWIKWKKENLRSQ
jgi:UDP-N-acetylglucosamine 4,6-dehydratase